MLFLLSKRFLKFNHPGIFPDTILAPIIITCVHKNIKERAYGIEPQTSVHLTALYQLSYTLPLRDVLITRQKKKEKGPR